MALDDEMTDSYLSVCRLRTLFIVRLCSFERTDDIVIEEKHENPSVRIADGSVNI
jgi:hypothetical protein